MPYNSSLGKILLVDDDVNITELLQYNLDSEGYEVVEERSAKAALDLELRDIRLIIVDASHQPFNGFDLLDALKNNPETEHIPVIILSSSDNGSNIIRALDQGAEDYVVKPFSLREFVARIRSVLRRHPQRTVTSAPTQQPSTVISFEDIEVDLRSGKVTSDGMLLPLSKTEYSILVILLRNVNDFVSRLEIFKQVWKDGESANERIVDTNISRLRKKLGDTGQKIINRSGLGYMLSDN